MLRAGMRSPKQLAAELECAEQTLRNWLRQDEADRSSLACSRVAERSRRSSSFSSEAKKLSARALSQGSPIEPKMPLTVPR